MGNDHPPTDDNRVFWERIRELYHLPPDTTYLNNAFEQPWPLPVSEAVRSYATKMEDAGAVADATKATETLRATFARWLGCSHRDLALTCSTSNGLLKAIHAIDWRKGDEILYPLGVFPAASSVFRAAADFGAVLRPVGTGKGVFTEEDIIERAGPNTRAVVVSWVSYSTGYRMDLAYLSRSLKEKGVEFVFVDGVQGAGACEADLSDTEVDFFAFRSGKWIAGPTGTGALYIRPALLDGLKDSCISWFSLPCCENLNLLDEPDLVPFDSARRYDGGMPVFLSIAAVQAYFDMLQPVGIAGVAGRLRFLVAELGRRLKEKGIKAVTDPFGNHASAIISIETPNASATQLLLKRAGVVTSLRGDRIRVSPHLFNESGEFDLLVQIIAENR